MDCHDTVSPSLTSLSESFRIAHPSVACLLASSSGSWLRGVWLRGVGLTPGARGDTAGPYNARAQPSCAPRAADCKRLATICPIRPPRWQPAVQDFRFFCRVALQFDVMDASSPLTRYLAVVVT